jgi:hypothetical protein
MDNQTMLKTLPDSVSAIMRDRMEQHSMSANAVPQPDNTQSENPLEKVGHFFESAGKDIVKGIAKVFSFVSVMEKLFSDSKQAEPQVKQLIGEVLSDVAPFVALMKPIIASGGENIIADASALAELISVSKKLIATFETAIPLIEKNFNNLLDNKAAQE